MSLLSSLCPRPPVQATPTCTPALLSAGQLHALASFTPFPQAPQGPAPQPEPRAIRQWGYEPMTFRQGVGPKATRNPLEHEWAVPGGCGEGQQVRGCTGCQMQLHHILSFQEDSVEVGARVWNTLVALTPTAVS